MEWAIGIIDKVYQLIMSNVNTKPPTVESTTVQPWRIDETASWLVKNYPYTGLLPDGTIRFSLIGGTDYITRKLCHITEILDYADIISDWSLDGAKIVVGPNGYKILKSSDTPRVLTTRPIYGIIVWIRDTGAVLGYMPIHEPRQDYASVWTSIYWPKGVDGICSLENV
jgi:hypothetical protein